MYSIILTREFEKIIFEEFRTLHAEFPNGDYQQTDRPDFIIKSESNKIGVEITEVFQDSHLGHSKYQQRSSVRHLITKKLIEKLQEIVPFTFHVSIHFSDHIPIRKNKEQELIDNLFNCCSKPLRELKNYQSMVIEDYFILPDTVDFIRINRYDGLDESFDEKPDGGVVSNLEYKHLKPILQKKDSKLDDYQKCDEYWLLIREGNYYAGTFKELNLELPVQSKFDKVYLFRTNENSIIELK